MHNNDLTKIIHIRISPADLDALRRSYYVFKASVPFSRITFADFIRKLLVSSKIDVDNM